MLQNIAFLSMTHRQLCRAPHNVVPTRLASPRVRRPISHTLPLILDEATGVDDSDSEGAVRVRI